jgi:hypothetical protein
MIRPLRSGCEVNLIRGTTNDQRDDEPSRALLEKSSGADLLREMIGFTAQRLMELEVEGRNGYRDRGLRGVKPDRP